MEDAVDGGLELVIDAVDRSLDVHLNGDAVCLQFTHEIVHGGLQTKIIEACRANATNHPAGVLEAFAQAATDIFQCAEAVFGELRILQQSLQQHGRAHDILDQPIMKLVADQLSLLFLQIDQVAKHFFTLCQLSVRLLDRRHIGGDASHRRDLATVIANGKLD